MTIKYPRVEVSVARHTKLAKEAKKLKISMKALVEKKLKSAK